MPISPNMDSPYSSMFGGGAASPQRRAAPSNMGMWSNYFAGNQSPMAAAPRTSSPPPSIPWSQASRQAPQRPQAPAQPQAIAPNRNRPSMPGQQDAFTPPSESPYTVRQDGGFTFSRTKEQRQKSLDSLWAMRPQGFSSEQEMLDWLGEMKKSQGYKYFDPETGNNLYSTLSGAERHAAILEDIDFHGRFGGNARALLNNRRVI